MSDSKEVKPSKGKGKFIPDTSDMKKVSRKSSIPCLICHVYQRTLLGRRIKYKITPEQMNDLFSSVIATLKESEIDNDRKAKQVVDLVNGIRELHETVTEQKMWDLQKVAQSETRLSKDYLELQELRMAKAKMEEMENKKEHLERSLAVKITEEYVQPASCQASAITDKVMRLELQNAQIRADTLAYKITASESAKKLSEIMKRGNKCAKKLADMEKQTSTLKTQYEKELLKDRAEEARVDSGRERI